MYRVSTDTWTILDYAPGINSTHGRVEVCGYHDGYIYAIFGIGPERIDRQFHIFNTIENSWSISEAELNSDVVYTTAAVIY